MEKFFVVLGILYGVACYALIMFFILKFVISKFYVRRLRSSECVFQKTPLEKTLVKDESYNENDKVVYKTGMDSGSVYIENSPTIIKGKYVPGKKVYILKSKSLGYEIEREETPFDKCITPAWTLDSTDTPSYQKKHMVNFNLINNGNLTPKQVKKLQKIINKASFEY